MTLAALVFDCDGVILDSVQVKSRAFARLAEPYGPEARDMLIMYHSQHGGVSRYVKFDWFFREVLHKQISQEESVAWGRRFAEYALDEVRACPLIPGALATLEAWRGKIPMYVCSGAPTEELMLILRERQLARYFAGIYGAPPEKSKLLCNLVNNELKADPADVVMIGDANTDRQAAEECDTLFYGIGPGLKGGAFPWSMDLIPFNQWLTEYEREHKA